MMATVAGPALALEPLPVCHQTAESGMEVMVVNYLGDGGPSGIVVEGYVDAKVWRGMEAKVPPAPAQLKGFNGVRVMHCPTGRFIAVPHLSADEARIALGATEFLRPKLKAGKTPGYGDMKKAVDVLYPGGIAFRETAETCGCNAFFPELKPKGMTPYAERTDVNH